MARKRQEDTDAEPSAEPGVYMARIEPNLVPKLKMVAAALGISAPNYINSRLEKVINAELLAAVPAKDADGVPSQAQLDVFKPVERAASRKQPKP